MSEVDKAGLGEAVLYVSSTAEDLHVIADDVEHGAVTLKVNGLRFGEAVEFGPLVMRPAQVADLIARLSLAGALSTDDFATLVEETMDQVQADLDVAESPG